jgi:hypothetical protein
MSNITVHLGSTTPFFFSGRPTRARTPLASLSPPPLLDGPRPSASPPPGTVAAAHPSASPPSPLFSRQRAHGARRACPQGSGHCRPGAAHRSAGTPPPAGRILLPHASFVSPVHARAPHMLPHRPGVRLVGFSLPEPLLRAGLCPSVATVPPLR